ncbi:Hypothetical predicted protein [Lecanosticta acicola]|uniref:Vegetatible incompatibility protein HET-E-1 n=1 Tax=Lecanosticta acicola TaxID=111012 RepID=A0AAI8W0K6_9PEZI|nr:Hypothetical predicted protein [Lecanosticta acicola]
MNDYESRRQERIRKNQALLAELDVKPIIPKQARNDARPPVVKKRKLHQDAAPARTSARIASAGVKPSYNEDELSRPVAFPGSTPKKGKKPRNPRNANDDLKEPEPLVPTKNVDEIQAGWAEWKATAPAPSRDENRNFHFDDFPDFTPNKSPEEMLQEGCFGGSYYRPLRSRKLGIVIEDDWRELPPDWISGLHREKFVTSPEYDAEVNKFKVSCGQSIEEWEAAGWIRHEHDARGWFQWYTRFIRGRRCEDDERQVSRWKKCVGETGRWRRMLLKKYMQSGVREVFDDGAEEDAPEVSPVMHQTCHHWAFEVRQEHLDAFWASGGR